MELEFSRLINIQDQFTDKKGVVDISATAEECSALAERMEFDSVKSLTLKGLITCEEEIFIFEGVVRAEVTHSFEGAPETDVIEEDLTILCLEDEPEEDPEEDYEIMEDGCVNFGELAAQYVCLISCANALGEEKLEEMMNAIEGDDPETAFKKLEALLQGTKH